MLPYWIECRNETMGNNCDKTGHLVIPIFDTCYFVYYTNNIHQIYTLESFCEKRQLHYTDYPNFNKYFIIGYLHVIFEQIQSKGIIGFERKAPLDTKDYGNFGIISNSKKYLLSNFFIFILFSHEKKE